MALKLEDSGARPKSNAGRRAKELDSAFLSALTEALRKNPTVTDGEDIRPRMYGPDTLFDTKGKATSEGRRYQTAIEKSGLKVRVTGMQVKTNGQPDKYKWRVYVPLANAEIAEAA